MYVVCKCKNKIYKNDGGDSFKKIREKWKKIICKSQYILGVFTSNSGKVKRETLHPGETQVLNGSLFEQIGCPTKFQTKNLPRLSTKPTTPRGQHVITGDEACGVSFASASAQCTRQPVQCCPVSDRDGGHARLHFFLFFPPIKKN